MDRDHKIWLKYLSTIMFVYNILLVYLDSHKEPVHPVTYIIIIHHQHTSSQRVSRFLKPIELDTGNPHTRLDKYDSKLLKLA
jgi:hypothetical protein